MHAARVARRFARYGVDTKAAWITRDNVNQLARDYRLDGEIDLLSLDLDGNDYWVWQALEVCSPRMVILEFNHWFGAERAVTMPYDPAFTRDKSATRGQALLRGIAGGVRATRARERATGWSWSSPAG